MDVDKVWEDFLTHRTVTSKSLKDIFDLERAAMSQLFKSECKELLVDITNVIDDRLGIICERISVVETSMSVVENEILILKSAVSDLSETSQKQSAEIIELKAEITELKSLPSVDDSSLRKCVNDLEERVEDRTNRQLRKTLVITGVKESDKESWSDTKKLVAKTISTNLNLDYYDAYDMLERVHRSAPTKLANKIGRRDIYASIHDWNDCEFLTSEFRQANRKNRNLNIHVNCKYGPLTTRRRNEALKVRRELLNDNKITQGYISFPAKLLVKYSNDADAKFDVYNDFSKLSISDLK